jgi:hypothetical protein
MVTAEHVRNARLQAVCFLDGRGFYERHYRCVEFPALVKVVRGPRGKKRHFWPEGSAGAVAADAVTVTYFVHGHPVADRTLAGLAAALNAPAPEGATIYVDPLPHTRRERIGV